MEFTIDRETFLEGIKATLGIVEKQSAMPILQNLLIKTCDDGIEISANNREIGIRTNYTASVIKPGELTIPARKLSEIVRELQGETIHLVVKKGSAMITSNKAVCRINGMEASDYPQMVKAAGYEPFMISPVLLRDMLKKVSYATLKDNTSRNLSGIFIQKIINDGAVSIRMAATDSKRLAIATAPRTELDLPITERGVIIPGKGFSEIKKISESTEDDMSIGFVTGACIVEADRSMLRVSLIDGPYPDFQRVIPSEQADGMLAITVVRDTLLHALHRLAVYGTDCALDIHGGVIHLEARDPEIGEIKDEVEIDQLDQGKSDIESEKPKKECNAKKNRHGLCDHILRAGISGDKCGVEDCCLKCMAEDCERKCDLSKAYIHEVQGQATERTVKFNVHYLIDAIEAVTDEKVVLNIYDGFGGTVIRGSKDKNYLSVVMPLKG